MLEMSKDDLIPAIDENLEKSLYTPQQNGVAKRKNKALKEIVNSMLSYLGLSEGFWGEAMLTACYLLNRAIVRLPDPKRKTLGKKGIDCIFVGYTEHSKAYMFYIIEPNDSISINSTIESRDAVFNENRFSSIPRPKDIIPNSDESQRDDLSDDVPNEIPEPRKEAIEDEIGSIMENNTWVLSDLPPGCKPLAIHNLVIHQMDVKITFLNGDLDEEVYMKQPEGFIVTPPKMCRSENMYRGRYFIIQQHSENLKSNTTRFDHLNK
uniref:Uncharacterized protein n=1 Tax=Tanacetum cinerariifolium TaxID=118510 RepID=A0A699JPL2_TANCI|nr:hypothetical protein [Tanacetum cinerariifolium]